MPAPSMSSITASLERSLLNFSLNHHQQDSSSSSTSSNSGGGGGGDAAAAGAGSNFQESQHDLSNNNSSEATFELNSHISLPYHWEQCLDLKTGELYYINWRTGMKAKEDPRTTGAAEWNTINCDDFDSEDDDEDDDDNSLSYETTDEGSSTESSPSSSSVREQRQQCSNVVMKTSTDNERRRTEERRGGHVLVVAGCKSCFMYFMVPKQLEVCPKCCGLLLHFDKSYN